LLDHAATQIGIDEPGLGSPDGIAELLISDPFMVREAGERLGPIDMHPAPAIFAMILSAIALSNILCNSVLILRRAVPAAHLLT